MGLLHGILQIFWSQGKEAILYEPLILQTNSENWFQLQGRGCDPRFCLGSQAWLPVGSIISVWGGNRGHGSGEGRLGRIWSSLST